MKDLSEIKTRVAEALFPAFESFQSVSGRVLRSVWQVEVDGNKNKLILGLDTLSLVILANVDDDSISFWNSSNDADRIGGMDVSDSDPWHAFIGKRFTWGWMMVNQQGYCDGVLLSFEVITPQLVLNVVASSIKVGVVTM